MSQIFNSSFLNKILTILLNNNIVKHFNIYYYLNKSSDHLFQEEAGWSLATVH